jgi:hypothetical protein
MENYKISIRTRNNVQKQPLNEEQTQDKTIQNS